ncbi:MAG: D-alanyl-D-alanine carboxypeptidase/D-alanyl-D-alanine-endopeptidase [Pseudomonadota bacterium]
MSAPGRAHPIQCYLVNFSRNFSADLPTIKRRGIQDMARCEMPGKPADWIRNAYAERGRIDGECLRQALPSEESSAVSMLADAINKKSPGFIDDSEYAQLSKVFSADNKILFEDLRRSPPYVARMRFFSDHAADSAYFRNQNLPGANFSASMRYMDTGEGVAFWARNAPLAPASSLKTLVTAAALVTLGEDYRFHTQLYHTGVIAGGTLYGDLVLAGGGDPTLGSSMVNGSQSMDGVLAQLSRFVHRAGIRHIEGSVRVDNSRFSGPSVPASWTDDDLGNYYAAPVDALSINNNEFRLIFKPGEKPGDPAALLRTEPEIKGLQFTNNMKTGETGSGDHGYVRRLPGEYHDALEGTVPAGVREFAIKGSIPEPALFAGRALKKKLEADGVTISVSSIYYSEGSDHNTQQLGDIASPPLKDIIRVTNSKSVNLYAEMLARALAVETGHEGSLQGGLDAIVEFLRASGIDTSSVTLADASGLSRMNSISSEVLSELLGFMSTQPVFGSFQHSLAHSGGGGGPSTARAFGGGRFRGEIFFKSGYIHGVRSYCGYAMENGGRPISFSFIFSFDRFLGGHQAETFVEKALMAAQKKGR